MAEQTRPAAPGGGLGRNAGFALMALLSVGVALYALSYLSGRAFPPGVRDNYAGTSMLVLHVATAAFALLTGPWQFLPRLRTRHRRIHRWNGRAYAAACLVGGLAGMVVAWNVATGEVARWGFFFLSLAWLSTTTMGWLAARRADYITHRAWMVRSYAMALAAVTLRIYLGVSIASGATFEDAYPIIAWACWVPNLIAAELWLRRPVRT